MYSFFVPTPATGYIITACSENGEYSFGEPPSRQFSLQVGERHYVLPPFAASPTTPTTRQPCGVAKKVPVAVAGARKPTAPKQTAAASTKAPPTAASSKPKTT